MSRLLEIITTRSDISFTEFNKAFDFLYGKEIPEVEVNNTRRLVARFLEELGHCEFAYSKRKVFCCKPDFIRLPSTGVMSAVLTGARIPETISKLRKIQNQYKDRMIVTEKGQIRDGIPLPDVVTITSSEKDLFFAVGRDLQVGCQCDTPAAWILLNASANIAEYESTLLFQVSLAKGWLCRKFSISDLHFTRVVLSDDINGLLEFTHPVTQQKTYIWHSNANTVETEKDWGRYLALKYAGINILIYDKLKQLMGVPYYVPLPKVLARAITLCSGIAASEIALSRNLGGIPAGTTLDIYHGVPENIADLLARKVGQELILNSFTLSEEGEIHD